MLCCVAVQGSVAALDSLCVSAVFHSHVASVLPGQQLTTEGSALLVPRVTSWGIAHLECEPGRLSS